MDDILEGIKTGRDLDKQVDRFASLAKTEKIKILNAMKKIGAQEVGAFLSIAYPAERDRVVHKMMRSLIHRFRTMGEVIEEPRVGGDTVLRKIEEKRDRLAFMSNYDYTGSRIVIVALETKKNNYIFIHGTTEFTIGLTELITGETDRATLDSIVNDYRSSKNEAMIITGISPFFGMHLLEEDSRQSGKFHDKIMLLKNALPPAPQGEVRLPEDIYTLSAPESTIPLSPESIFIHPMFEALLITWERLEEDIKAFDDIGSSGIILPRRMIEEKKRVFVEAILERREMKQKINVLRRTLEDYAYIFYSIGELHYYRGLMDILGNQDRFRETSIEFILQSLDTDPEEEDEEGGEESGIIINPYE